MSETRPWYWRPAALDGLGLRLTVVRRYGKRAFWAICRECGDSVLALACEDCAWDLGSLILVANHVRAHRDMRKGLALFVCPRKCNSDLCDDPPREVLIAQAEEAAAENSGRAREEVRGRRKRRAAAR